MRKLLSLVALTALVVTLVVAVTSNTGADAAPAHTSTEVRNVCSLLELSIAGPNPNLVGLAKSRSVHLFGLHLAQCCFYDIRNGIGFVGQYSWGFDDVDWFYDPWCSL